VCCLCCLSCVKRHTCERFACVQPSSKKAKLANGLESSAAGAAHTPAAHWLASQVEDIGEFAAAVLLLMAETAAGAASPFAPAIAALPATHHCVMAWSPEEMAMLRGTAIAEELPDTGAFFEDMVAPVAARRRDLWPEGAWCAAAQDNAPAHVSSCADRIREWDLEPRSAGGWAGKRAMDP